MRPIDKDFLDRKYSEIQENFFLNKTLDKLYPSKGEIQIVEADLTELFHIESGDV